jgi:hypothetical protein
MPNMPGFFRMTKKALFFNIGFSIRDEEMRLSYNSFGYNIQFYYQMQNGVPDPKKQIQAGLIVKPDCAIVANILSSCCQFLKIVIYWNVDIIIRGQRSDVFLPGMKLIDPTAIRTDHY